MTCNRSDLPGQVAARMTEEGLRLPDRSPLLKTKSALAKCEPNRLSPGMKWGARNGDLIMGALKLFLVAASILLGVLLLYEGHGLDFRVLDYERLETYGIPLGIIFIAIGALIAKYWRVAD